MQRDCCRSAVSRRHKAHVKYRKASRFPQNRKYNALQRRLVGYQANRVTLKQIATKEIIDKELWIIMNVIL